MTISKTIPELLAPAGTLEAGLAAFEHGADAVYCGLPKFNARERGENFSFADLSKLIGQARKTGKRVHIALNTLLKPDEIGEALDLAGEASLLGPDAIIVQDLGLLRLLHRHFPELELHASTQMGTHNSAGIAMLKQLGASRVVLERQVTLAEMGTIAQRSPLPVEVFVHGALCCCRSGSCLFSSWLGGWSGNRGKCKQPCRRRFFSTQGNGFFFSPGDLNLLERIPEVVGTGVASLKIEGRLRGPDYVAAVVSAYRTALDLAAREEPANAGQTAAELGRAKKKLNDALGRRWTEGFVDDASLANVLQHTTLGGSGRPCGQVLRSSPDGFMARITREIHLGERLRPQPRSGDEGASFVVDKMVVKGKSVAKAFSGEEVFFAWNQPVERDSLLYQVGMAAPELKIRPADLPEARILAPLQITATPDGVTVSTPLPPHFTWTLPLKLEPASKHGLAAETVAAEWRKGEAPAWRAGQIQFHSTTPLFLPGSELRRIRQEFWKQAATAWPAHEFHAEMKKRLEPAQAEATRKLPPGREPAISTFRLAVGQKPARLGRDQVAAVDVEAWTPAFAEAVLPPFCPEPELEALRRRIARAWDQGCRKFRLTSLFQFELMRPYAGAELTASLTIPVCNNAALDTLLELGARRATAWIELDKPAFEALLADNPGRIEILAYARLPLLETRAQVAVDGPIKDARGEGFRVIRENGLARLYAGPVFALDDLPASIPTYRDFSHAEPGETDTRDFNYSHALV